MDDSSNIKVDSDIQSGHLARLVYNQTILHKDHVNWCVLSFHPDG